MAKSHSRKGPRAEKYSACGDEEDERLRNGNIRIGRGEKCGARFKEV